MRPYWMENVKYKQLILLILFSSMYLCLEMVSIILYFLQETNPGDIFPWYIDFVYVVLMICCAVIVWEELHWSYFLVLAPVILAALDFFWAMQINGEVLFAALDHIMLEVFFPAGFPYIHSLIVLLFLIPSIFLIWKKVQ